MRRLQKDEASMYVRPCRGGLSSEAFKGVSRTTSLCLPECECGSALAVTPESSLARVEDTFWSVQDSVCGLSGCVGQVLEAVLKKRDRRVRLRTLQIEDRADSDP